MNGCEGIKFAVIFVMAIAAFSISIGIAEDNGKRIVAGDFTATGGRNTYGVHTGGDGVIGDIYTWDWVRYSNIDLSGVKKIRVMAAVPMQKNVRALVYIGVENEHQIQDGKLIAIFEFGEELDKNWSDMRIRETTLIDAHEGNHKVYVIFLTEGDASGLGTVAWFEFVK